MEIPQNSDVYLDFLLHGGHWVCDYRRRRHETHGSRSFRGVSEPFGDFIDVFGRIRG